MLIQFAEKNMSDIWDPLKKTLFYEYFFHTKYLQYTVIYHLYYDFSIILRFPSNFPENILRYCFVRISNIFKSFLFGPKLCVTCFLRHDMLSKILFLTIIRNHVISRKKVVHLQRNPDTSHRPVPTYSFNKCSHHPIRFHYTKIM